MQSCRLAIGAKESRPSGLERPSDNFGMQTVQRFRFAREDVEERIQVSSREDAPDQWAHAAQDKRASGIVQAPLEGY